MSRGRFPSVLLNECSNGIRQIDAKGPAFDPAREKIMQL
jgi:hypothetical protein